MVVVGDVVGSDMAVEAMVMVEATVMVDMGMFYRCIIVKYRETDRSALVGEKR